MNCTSTYFADHLYQKPPSMSSKVVHIQLTRSNEKVVELTDRLQSSRREQAHFQNQAVLEERARWEKRLDEMQSQLAHEKFEKQAQMAWQARFIEGSKDAATHHEQRISNAAARMWAIREILPDSRKNEAAATRM